MSERQNLYGWWQFEPSAAALVRATDGANLRLLLESERPDPLTRVFVFRADLPGIPPVLVPIEALDRSRENKGYLTWCADLAASQFDHGGGLLEHDDSLAVEWFLIDALSAWPENTAAGRKPGLVELRGGRVNGCVVEGRWRQFHSCLSSNGRPRRPVTGLPFPSDKRWEFIRPVGSECLPDIPDFDVLSRSEFCAWLDERVRNAPRLVSGTSVMFPLRREYDTGLRWVFCDREIVFDRLVSWYDGLQPSNDWRWACARESLTCTRHAASGSVFDYPGSRRGEPFPRKRLEQGWEESPRLPASLSQRIAEAISQASYRLEETTFSLADRRADARVEFHLVPPRHLRYHFAFTGGTRRMGLSEGLAGGRPQPFVPLQSRVAEDRGHPPRFSWNTKTAEMRDLHSGRRLSFERLLAGTPLAEAEQWFQLRYRDETLEWPLFVHRRPRQDGYRAKPWLVDARPTNGAVPPDEATFTGMLDFVSVALNGWPDDERSGPAPQNARIFGGYLNGTWRKDYGIEVSGSDPRRQRLDDAWLEPDLELSTLRWTKAGRGSVGAPPAVPEPGSVRPSGYLAEWLAENDHGATVRAEDGSAVLANVGSITTTGHGGGTTNYWEYQDQLLWLRLTSSSRWGWRARAGGPVDEADRFEFERLAIWDGPRKVYFLGPRLILQLRRARLALLDRPGAIEMSWLPIDGAIIPGTASHFIEAQVPQPIWLAVTC